MELFTPHTPDDADAPRQSAEELHQARAVRLSEVRRRRNRKRAQVAAAFVLAGLLILALIAGAFTSSLTSLADLGDSIRIGMTPGGSFPVKTGIAQVYQAEPLVGGFVALGEKDVVLASASGLKLRTIQHGYARPALAVGGSRFCVYNRAGYGLRVESRSQTLYSETLQDPILVCAMSQNGSLAVATRSDRYVAQVKIYDSNLRYRYGWSTTDAEGTPMRMAFAPDNKRLAVACLRAEQGQITTCIHLLDTRSDAVQLVIQAPGSTLLQLHWVGGSQLLAVYDDHTALYDASTGAEKARYDYGSALTDASVNGKYTALLLDGADGAGSRLVVLGGGLTLLSDTQWPQAAHGVTVTGTGVYLLQADGVVCQSLRGQAQWRAAMDERPQWVLSARKLLVFTGGQADWLQATEQLGE
ncbi:MAG: protein TolB [Oscillospiraceae bacterium]|nr:protein TolB [Oscillospiraceae bacterium]